MKLVVAAFLTACLALPSIAKADTLNPPSGPVEDDADAEAAPMPVNNPGQLRGQMQGQMRRQRDPARVAKRQQLRQALLAEFDVNGDGRLGPRERVRAVKMLRRLEGKLAAPMMQRGQMRAQRQRQFMNRYDVNRDGQVDRNEVPNGAMRRLRPYDRNGDGWVDGNEMP
jgi:hypothetical protein